jgi:hypothetical protein
MSKVFNEERFSPSRLSGLSLWMDAGDSTTITTTTSNVTSWNDKSGKANNLVTNFTSTFLPTSLNSCKLWLDGGDVTSMILNGSSVTQWNDKSGNANNATANGSAITQTSKGLVFNGNSYMPIPGLAGSLVNTPFVVFIVEILSSCPSYGIIFGDDSQSHEGMDQTLHIGYRSETDFTFALWADDLDTPSSATSGFGIIRLWTLYLPTSSNRNIRLNGSTIVTHTNYTRLGQFTNPVIGRFIGGSLGYYNGTISEIIVYNQDIGLNAIQQTEGYLAWKWGLQGKLPSTHPYYNSFPIITSPTPIFTPKSVSGLYLWLDAADSSTIVKSGTSVTSWNDKSGNNFSATALDNTPITLQSQNNNSTVYLPSIRMSIPNFTWRYAFTMIIVSKNNNGTTLMGLGSGTNSTATWLGYANTGNWALLYLSNPGLSTTDPNYTTDHHPAPIVPANQWSIFTIGYNNGTNLTNYGINGTPYNATSVTPTTGSLTGYFILNGLPSGAYADLQIGEIIHYNYSINTSQRQQIEGYLAWKWGIQGNLPANHPYKNIPINVYPIVSTTTLNQPSIYFQSGAQMQSIYNSGFGSFSPTTLPGCQLWFDAADPNGNGVIPANNSTITSWVDKSGNGNTGTVTGTPKYYANGFSSSRHPYIYFDGRSWFLGNTTNTGTTLTAFFVGMTPASQTTNTRVLSLGTPNDVDYHNSTQTIAIYQPGSIVGTYRNPNQVFGTITVGQPYLTCSLYDGTNGYSILNGTTVGTFASTGSFGITSYGLGNYVNAASGANEPFIGYMGEVLLFTTALTTSQRQQVEGYLAWKWGLQGNLPANHPYSPTNVSSFSSSSITRLLQPTDVSIPALWLDGADPLGTGILPSNGASIPVWNDKSGNGYNGTAPATNATYSLSTKGVVFTGTQSYATTLPSLIPKQSGFAIVSYNSSSKMDIISLNAQTVYSGIQQIILSDSLEITTFGGTIIVQGGSVSQNTPFLYNYSFDATSSAYIYLNGTQTSSTTGPYTFSGSGLVNIGGFNGASEGFKGTMFEIVLYNSILTTFQRQQVEGYLAWKWGLQTKLPSTHPFYNLPPFFTPPPPHIPKTMIMLYQCPQTTSTMRFSVGNDVSGGAFGLAQSNGSVYSPYQYAYGDTYWSVNSTAYTLPNVSIAIYDASSNVISGSYNFNANLDNRIKALQNTISDSPYVLGTSINQFSIFTSSNFHVNEIITYNRGISVTERQEIEGYLAWKWGLVNFLPIGHPYSNYPPSGEQVVPQSIPSNVFSGLVLWLDMADSTQYATNGSYITSIKDKVSTSNFTISGNTNILKLSNIGTLPSVNFGGNNDTSIPISSRNPFIYKTLNVPPQGSTISIIVPASQLTSKLGIYTWSNNSPALGFNSPTNANSTIQSYNPGTSVFYGPSLNLTIGMPTILYWAWYGGNMVYLSCNGTTLLSSSQTSGLYSTTSTNNTFYIGNDSGYGANFNLGELCVYNAYLETPFRQIMEGYLAWKWGIESSLPSNHPYYLSSPTLQTLTDINSFSFPTDLSSLTLWIDTADTSKIITVGNNVSTLIDKSPVVNNFLSNSALLPVVSNFGSPSRPSVFFGPGSSLKSLYNSGASGNQFSAFVVASIPNLSYMLISTGQLTTGTAPVAGQSSFGFYASNATNAVVYSPYVGAASGVSNLVVGNYSTINGKTFELFANSSGQILNGNMVFNTLCNVTNTNLNITATPWVIGDCVGDTIPKSFHLHEMITYSRNLTTTERQSIEGYLVWKWFN